MKADDYFKQSPTEAEVYALLNPKWKEIDKLVQKQNQIGKYFQETMTNFVEKNIQIKEIIDNDTISPNEKLIKAKEISSTVAVKKQIANAEQFMTNFIENNSEFNIFDEIERKYIIKSIVMNLLHEISEAAIRLLMMLDKNISSDEIREMMTFETLTREEYEEQEALEQQNCNCGNCNCDKEKSDTVVTPNGTLEENK